MTATYGEAEASTPSMQAVASPRRPMRCRHRIRGLERASARTGSSVPSRESSSTKIASHATSRNVDTNNATRGSMLACSLRVGMMMVKIGGAIVFTLFVVSRSRIVISPIPDLWPILIPYATRPGGNSWAPNPGQQDDHLELSELGMRVLLGGDQL